MTLALLDVLFQMGVGSVASGGTCVFIPGHCPVPCVLMRA